MILSRVAAEGGWDDGERENGKSFHLYVLFLHALLMEAQAKLGSLSTKDSYFNSLTTS